LETTQPRRKGEGRTFRNGARCAAFSTFPSIQPTETFQLLPEDEKHGATEDVIFEKQVKDVKAWWSSPRFKDIKRPYTAEDVVSKRGTMQQVYPSSLMARKLFDLFEKRAAEKKPVHTRR